MDVLINAVGGILGKRTGRPRFKSALDLLNAEVTEGKEKRQDHIANTFTFNVIIVVLIVLNAVVSGIEVDQYRGDRLEDRLIFFAADFLFFLAFFAEMLVRMNQQGWDYFADRFNVLDYLIIVLNCSDLVISVENQGSAGIKLASTLRCIRLLRVVRVIRHVTLFKTLWIIIQGILDSLWTLIWVGTLLVIFIYCISVAITTLLIGDSYAQERWRDCDKYWGTPWRSMWTVFQVITLDRWANDIARPLAQVSPFAMVLLLVTIIICTFGITNLIVAVMVERVWAIIDHSTDVTNRVLEDMETNVIKSLGEDFHLADLDASGVLSFEEFKRVLHSDSVKLKLQILNVQYNEAETLFQLMDIDGDGTVSPEEFVFGLKKLKGVAAGQDLVALICCAEKQAFRAAKLVERIRALNKKADVIQGRLDTIGKGMTEELVGRKTAGERNTEVWTGATARQQVISTLDRARQVEFPALRDGSTARYGIRY